MLPLRRNRTDDWLAVDLGSLVADVKERVTFDELSGKTIAIDAYNTIYQFLSIIRQPDGSPLVDSKNRVTSHLSGLFYRIISLMEHRINPVFIFDGIPPHLKQRTIAARMKRRSEAMEEWKKAKEEGTIEEARMHAMASTRITKEVVESSKELLGYMGIPFMQAPGEGEAQASYLAHSGLVYAAASQDYDLFLFGSDVVVRNMTITGRRKLPRKNVYIDVEPERIFLKKLLEHLGIDRQQLVMLGMLIGTDFNEGIDGVGPKTAFKIIREKKSMEMVCKYVEEKYNVECGQFQEAGEIFMKPDVTEMAKEEFDTLMSRARPEKEALIRFMCDEHGFAQERINRFVENLLRLRAVAGQKGMDKWL